MKIHKLVIVAAICSSGLCGFANAVNESKNGLHEAPFSFKTKVDLVPGKRYRVSCRFKQDNLRLKDGRESEARIGFWIYDAHGKVCRTETCHGGFSVRGKKGSADWYELADTSVTIPTNAVYAYFEQYTEKKAVGKVWLADAKVEPFDPSPVDYVVNSAYRDEAWDGDVTFTMSFNSGFSTLGCRAEMEYPGADGHARRIRMEFSGVEHSASAKVPVCDMAMGTNDFRFVLLRSDGTGELWSATMKFARTNGLAHPEVWCGPDGKFVVRGKKFWPLATTLWGADLKLGPEVRRMLEECSYNSFVMNGVDGKLLDWIEKCGKMAIARLPHDDGGLVMKLQELKGRPCVLMWYLYDEPHAFGNADKMRKHERLARLHDPDHPTRSCFDRIYYARMFLDCQDVICADPYPIGGGAEIGQVLDYTRQLNSGIFASKPLIMTLQSFDWTWYRGVADERARGNHVRRMPTENEMRNMAWQAIAGGANGLTWYSMHSLLSFLKPADKDRVLGEVLKVAREIADMIPVMLDEDVVLPGAAKLPKAVGVRAWRHGDKVHLVAVNSSRETVSCSLDFGNGFPQRNILIELAPIQTRFYELPNR